MTVTDAIVYDAYVTVLPHDNENSISGNVQLHQKSPNSPLLVKGLIKGLQPGKHGFHVHEKKILDNNCTSAGGHFNPQNVRFKQRKTT